ncbi:MAG: hypothetical protein R3B13_16515 [Polyangiaceae bacterium]
MMGSTSYLVNARDKAGLLVAMARALAGDAEISFEGDLASCHLRELPRASALETEVLRRNTLDPLQDFVVLPLEEETIKEVLADVIHSGRLSKILHVQIAKARTSRFRRLRQLPSRVHGGSR